MVRFKNGHLWAMGRLAQVRPWQVEVGQPWALLALEDGDPQTRGMGLWRLLQFPAGLRPTDLIPDIIAIAGICNSGKD